MAFGEVDSTLLRAVQPPDSLTSVLELTRPAPKSLLHDVALAVLIDQNPPLVATATVVVVLAPGAATFDRLFSAILKRHILTTGARVLNGSIKRDQNVRTLTALGVDSNGCS